GPAKSGPTQSGPTALAEGHAPAATGATAGPGQRRPCAGGQRAACFAASARAARHWGPAAGLAEGHAARPALGFTEPGPAAAELPRAAPDPEDRVDHAVADPAERARRRVLVGPHVVEEHVADLAADRGIDRVRHLLFLFVGLRLRQWAGPLDQVPH